MASSEAKAGFVDQLRGRCKRDWLAIRQAAQKAESQRLRLQTAIDNAGIKISSDVSFIVFGSLARDEWTDGSDVDWTLLIDGHADTTHLYDEDSRVRSLILQYGVF